jgi:segregation and condensation protein B
MGTNGKRLVESVLFQATSPVSVKEIVENTGLTSKTVRKNLKELIKDYNEKKDTSMEITKAGRKYTMQLKEEYADKTMMVADPEINENILKTLTLIAFHQPVKQSNLQRMIGNKAYEHVDQLTSMKLVNSKKHRNTEMLTTTKKFPEYFGIESTKPKEIRDYLMKKVADNQKNKEQ